jgi:hypothetical protein
MDKWGLLRQAIANATQGEGGQTAKGARVLEYHGESAKAHLEKV